MPETKHFVSLDDMANLDDVELQGFDPNADANARPPAIPAGPYVVKVRFFAENSNEWWENKLTNKTSEPYMTTTVSCEVVENPYNPHELVGRKMVFSNIFTLVNNNGTSAVQALIQALGGGDKLKQGKQTASRHALLLTELLRTEPVVGVETDWEARVGNPTKGEKDLFNMRGMRRFPVDPEKPGKHINETTWVNETTGESEQVPARNYLVRWYPVANMPKKGQGTTATASAAAPGPVAAPAPAAAPRQAPQRRRAG